MKEGDERRKIFRWTALTQTTTDPENLVRFCSRRTFLVFSLCGCHRLNSLLPQKWEGWRARPLAEGESREGGAAISGRRMRGGRHRAGVALGRTPSPAGELRANTGAAARMRGVNLETDEGYVTHLSQAPKQPRSPSPPPGAVKIATRSGKARRPL